MLEVASIVASAMFLLLLVVLAPVGMWWLSDPSRDAPSWIRSADTALQRGEADKAFRLALRAMSWPRRGRYSGRQAETTLASIAVAERAVHVLGAELPVEVSRVRDLLLTGERRVGDIGREARASLQGLVDHEEAPPQA